MNSSPPSRSPRFTLTNLLVAMACLGLLMAVFLTYLPMATSHARRIQCSNNLKQLGLSLHNYHDTYRSLPIGSRGAGYTKMKATATQDYASSWMVGVDEFAERISVPVQWDHEQGNGFDAGAPANPTYNMQRIDGYVPYNLRCPDSPLPELVLQGKHGTPNGRVLPTYVGIAGGVTQQAWRYHDSQRVVAQRGDATGILAGNGALLANDCINLDDMHDGTSNTMMVAEQSDYHTLGTKKIMANSGGTVGAWCGAKGNGIVGQNATATNPVAWNLTSMRYPVQRKRHATLPAGIFGPSDAKHLGNNNGIFSAHRGGAYAVFGDGRVKFLAEDTDLEVLVYMSIRDDGVELELPQ